MVGTSHRDVGTMMREHALATVVAILLVAFTVAAITHTSTLVLKTPIHFLIQSLGAVMVPAGHRSSEQ